MRAISRDRRTNQTNGLLERIGTKLVAMGRHEGGVSATEFAFFAPILVFGLLTATDLGMAAFQKIAVDQVLRSGAQVAMIDPGVDKVRNALTSTAIQNFSLDSSTPETGKQLISVNAERYCTCPGNSAVRVVCSTICSGAVPATFAYYSLTASKAFKGILLPQMTLSSHIQVQVR
jgi:pilus assembly protein CpaE